MFTLRAQINQNKVENSAEFLKAVKEAPRPQKIKQLQGFLGLINLQRKFIVDFTSVVRSLQHVLKEATLQGGSQRVWLSRHTETFHQVKDLLTASQPTGVGLLELYSPICHT